ncbi:Transposon Tf2-6 polyprotein [Dictyocoela muelleri]|nr:Transposon Tf2-6 polyprotein [Dictyocoela muelleri]
MIQEKIEELFFAGLHYRVKYDRIRNNNRTFNHCLLVLSDMDDMCLSKIQHLIEISKTKNIGDVTTYYKKENKNRQYYNNHKRNIGIEDKKYCNFHKTRSHSNEECRVNKKKSKNENNENNNKSYALREPINTPKIIEIPIKIDNKSFTSMVDTGSVENFIPEKIASEQKLEQKDLENEKTVEVANGSLVKIKKYCDVKFQIMNDENIFYKSKFMILPHPCNVLILGMRFLTENDTIINLKDGIISLDGKEYEVKARIPNFVAPDNDISRKTKIFSVKSVYSEINETINKAKIHNPEIGNIQIAKHKIELTGKFECAPREYPVPIGLQDEVKQHIKTLIKNDIIEEKESEIISPAFIIKKRNGKLRLVVDYRYLNSITRKDHQITPNIYEILAKLKGATIFSTLDLNNGYYQIKIEENDVFKTGFILMNKTYVFKRMPFGLCNAPSTFQKAMNNIFNEMKGVLVYMDDILLFSNTISDHKVLLNSVFEKLIGLGVSINFEKSVFAKEEVQFLGHKINKEGIMPIISNLDKYKDFRPKTKKQLQSLLGFINWFRPFIKNLSFLTADLYAKLKTEKNKVTWNETDEYKINEIFKKNSEKKILYHPDLNKEFTMRCDASDIGIGSVLLQEGKIIGYFSKKFNEQEKNYTTSEKEIYAILKSLEHFKQLIYNTRVIIETDNKNITFNGDITKRIHRWKLLLEEYDYILKHIKGNQNNEADTLSRYLLSIKSLQTHQLLFFPEVKGKLKEVNGISRFEILENDNTKLELEKFLKKLHVDMIHPGIIVMEKTLTNYIRMKNLRKLISKVCNECYICKIEKENTSHYGIPFYNNDVTEKNEVIAIDIKGPISASAFEKIGLEKNFYILAIVDLFSRFTEIGLTFDIDSETICSEIRRIWFSKHPIPKICLTDNGRQFISNQFKTMMDEFKIKHVTSAPYNPTGNAIVERTNKEIGNVLRISRNENLDNLLKNIWTRINLTINKNTNYAPFEIYYEKSIFHNLQLNPKINFEEINKKSKERREKYLRHLYKKRVPVKYEIGDKVLIKNHCQDKTSPRWLGPFSIINISKSGNNLNVDTGNKILRISIKNCRPAEKGEDVASHASPTLKEMF